MRTDQLAEIVRAHEAPAGQWVYVAAALVALVSPWLWGVALIAWPVLAHVLPRRTDDEGRESRRWLPALFLALVLGYVVAYGMVVVGMKWVMPVALGLAGV